MPPRSQPPFPSDIQLEQMGLRRCTQQPCSSWIDPQNLTETEGKCQHHYRSRPRKDSRQMAELRFAPRSERQRRAA